MNRPIDNLQYELKKADFAYNGNYVSERGIKEFLEKIIDKLEFLENEIDKKKDRSF